MTDAVKMATDGVVISRELLAFLCGDGPLDGHYFGEKPEHERGNFWWRKALRAAEQAALGQAGEPVAGIGTEDEADYAELKRLYNFTDDDSAQFTRWNMLTAIRHGQRLGQEFDAGEGGRCIPDHAGILLVQQL